VDRLNTLHLHHSVIARLYITHLDCYERITLCLLYNCLGWSESSFVHVNSCYRHIRSYCVVFYNETCNVVNIIYVVHGVDHGRHAVPLHYKPEGRGLDSRWCHWNFSFT
jgi:hypothetical protein